MSLSSPDADSVVQSVFAAVRPYTMTSIERIESLLNAVRYIVEHDIPGDIVECGVWRGGSMMAVAHMLRSLNAKRAIRLFDTFEGMPPPSPLDCDLHGRQASDLLAHADKRTSDVWAYSSLEEVQANLCTTGYDPAHLEFLVGRVEDTIPAHAPDRIALLRLDTDWYESTLHELQHLYPRLSSGGVLIIDDYGHWQGAKRAVDEYLATSRSKLLLNRIDYTGRIAVKVD
jgi:O-methyltransferase